MKHEKMFLRLKIYSNHLFKTFRVILNFILNIYDINGKVNRKYKGKFIR